MDQLDIIKMGTYNAVVMFGVIDDLGTIETGKMAGLVLLHEDPLVSISNTLAIDVVIKNGKIRERIEYDH